MKERKGRRGGLPEMGGHGGPPLPICTGRSLCLPVLAAVLLGGCSPGLIATGLKDLQANDLGYVVCIDGSGPPLTGQGHVLIIGLKKGFEGQIVVRENCQAAVDHYLPYREKVEELRKHGRPTL